MILAGLSPREKIRLYNNTLDKGNKPDLDYDDDLTGKGKNKLTGALFRSCFVYGGRC